MSREIEPVLINEIIILNNNKNNNNIKNNRNMKENMNNNIVKWKETDNNNNVVRPIMKISNKLNKKVTSDWKRIEVERISG